MHPYNSHDETIQKIIRSLNLTRDLYVTSVLIGEPHTGKRALVEHLFPELPVVDGREQDAVEKMLQEHDALIIDHYQALTNAEHLAFEGKRIIAIAEYEGNPRALDEAFAFIYRLPPLRDRPSDVALHAAAYQAEAHAALLIDADDAVAIPPEALDLSDNLRSLRAAIYRETALRHADEAMLERALHHHASRALAQGESYHRLLGLFEKPLLEAGLALFGSQLKLAEALGINRNTLRKKIHERL